MKTLFVLALAFFHTTSHAARCLPDDAGDKVFRSRCDTVVVSTRTPLCHVNEPWDAPYNVTDRNDNWYHVHGWNQVSLKAKKSTCEVTFEDCRSFAFRQLDKYRDVNPCGYVSVGKGVEYRYREFNSDRSISHERFGSFYK
jgi:hypothetical protein